MLRRDGFCLLHAHIILFLFIIAVLTVKISLSARFSLTADFFLSSQNYVAEPIGTLRRELSQTVIATYNLFHEKQMTIVSTAKKYLPCWVGFRVVVPLLYCQNSLFLLYGGNNEKFRRKRRRRSLLVPS